MIEDNRQQMIDGGQQTMDDGQQTDIVHRTPYIVQLLAQFFSYIFHPIFIPLYVVYFLAFVHPSYFSGFSMAAKRQTLIIVLINAVLFPLLSVFLLKGVGFIQSVFLKTQRDRIIPYMACGIFFFWTYLVFKNQTHYPLILPSFLLSVFLASSAALLANIYFKISMHAVGVGGLVGIFIIIMQGNTMLMTWPLCIALFIAGLVCTARLLVSNHTQKDIYVGFLVGVVSQFIGALVVL